MPPVAILAGGLATRLMPLTSKMPKSLLLVNNEPFIAHQLRLLARSGITDVVLCVGHLGEMIQKVVKDGRQFDLSVKFSFDGPSLLGTAGAIKRALPLLDAQFFVLYGDSYLHCDYGAAVAAFEESGKAGLMTVFRNEGRFDASNVEYSAATIRRYDKKNRDANMRHIDYGLGLFRASAFTFVGDGVCDLAQVYQQLLAKNQLAAFEVTERFYEIGSFTGLRELSDYLTGIPSAGAAQ